ncbi:hypothetical protein Ddc_20085 [Ditylenchus destructor]|nr:hypothetical protein Ddc_20085 [Ditylenchus destructor]
MMMLKITPLARAAALTVASGALLAGQGAIAQDRPDSPAPQPAVSADPSPAISRDAPAGPNALERVTVTSQFRVQDIQLVPLAVTAIDTKTAADQGLRLHDLFKFVPNAAAQNPDNEARPRIYIRGMGPRRRQRVHGDAGRRLCDGVYLNRRPPMAAASSTSSASRCCAARRARSTARTPSAARSSTSRASPISSPAPARPRWASAATGSAPRKAPGAAPWRATGSPPAWPSTSTSATLQQEHLDRAARRRRRQHGRSVFSCWRERRATFDALLKLHTRKLDDVGSNGSLVVGTYYPGTPAQYTRPDGRITEGRIANTQTVETDGGSLTLNQRLGGYLLTSITARDLTSSHSLGGGGTAPYEPQIRSKGDNAWRQTTQEFRLTSPKDERLRWIAGYHYFKEHLTSDTVAARYQASLVNLPVGPPAAQSAANPAYRDTAYVHDNTSPRRVRQRELRRHRRLHPHGGLRWTQEKKALDISLLQYNLANFNTGNFWELSSLVNPGAAATNSGSRQRAATWRNWTWDITPEYQFSHSLRGFLRVARGFRSGAFNVGIGSNLDTATTVKPEFVTSFEGGLKSEWFGGRLTANAKIFHYDYTDIQTNLLTPVSGGGVVSALANGPKAKRGRRGAGAGRTPGAGLAGEYSLALLNGRYTDFVNRNPVTQVVTSDSTGNRLARSPPRDHGARARLHLPLQRRRPAHRRRRPQLTPARSTSPLTGRPPPTKTPGQRRIHAGQPAAGLSHARPACARHGLREQRHRQAVPGPRPAQRHRRRQLRGDLRQPPPLRRERDDAVLSPTRGTSETAPSPPGAGAVCLVLDLRRSDPRDSRRRPGSHRRARWRRAPDAPDPPCRSRAARSRAPDRP